MIDLRFLLKLRWTLSPLLLRKLRVDNQPLKRRTLLVLCSYVAILFSSVLDSDIAASQPRRPFSTKALPAELQTLLENRPQGPIVTANTPSQKGFTVPSLWWTNQQFGEKLVVDWQVYGVGQVGNQQINVIVRPELWTRYSYYERYAFVLKFGTDASNFGYQLMVLDSQDFLLGAYTCDFAQSDPNFISGLLDARSQPIPDYVDRNSTQNLPCRLWLNPNYPRGVF